MTQNDLEDCDVDTSIEASASDDEKEFIIRQQHFIDKKDDHTDCFQQVQTMLKYYNKSERLRQKTKHKLAQAKIEIKRLRKQVRKTNTISNSLKNHLGDDQIKVLSGEYKKVPIWSNDTLKKAFKYKFACGTTGYKEIAHDWPLPSLRTLRRRLLNFKFQSGILDEVFDFLRIKIDTFQNELDKHCAIVLDEMTIAKGNLQ